MGVETVACPTCAELVRLGLPRGSEIHDVQSEAAEDTDETKTRLLSCSEGHAFAVQFTLG